MPKNIRNTAKVILLASFFVSAKSFATDDKKLKGDKNFPSLFTNSANAPVIKQMADSIYDLISLGDFGLEREVFFTAFKGFKYLQNKGAIRKTNLLTICDYSQSSNKKRLYVVDLLNSRLLFNTYVSHGKNSGDEFATSFSNHENSNKSSLGFLVTADIYNGKAGLSMRFNGMERGINDRVRSRAIVLHGSKFVSEAVSSMRGVISKSLGCPAVPYGIHTRIIEAIKGGSCFFINHSDQWYANTSTIVNAPFDLIPSIQINKAALDQEVSAKGENEPEPIK